MELQLLHNIQSMRSPILDAVFTSITSLGNGGIIWILMAIGFMTSKKYRKTGVMMAVSLLLCLILGNVILKNLLARPRPSWVDPTVVLLIENPKDYSFPSGHTLSSFASAGTVFVNHKKEGSLLLILAGMIAFSRLYLFVHYPTDILGGIALAGAIVLMSRWICVELERRRGCTDQHRNGNNID